MRKMHLSVAFAGLALFAGCDQNATSVTGNEGDSLIVASRAAAEGAWAPNKFLLGAGWNTSVRTLGEQVDADILTYFSSEWQEDYNEKTGKWKNPMEHGGIPFGMARMLAGSQTVPGIYTYFATNYAKAKLNLEDCDIAARNRKIKKGNTRSLCELGAQSVRNSEHQKVVLAQYKDYANRVYKEAPAKKSYWFLEGDFIQFSGDTQGDSKMTLAQIATYINQMAASIKSGNPNAIIGVNWSFWVSGKTNIEFWKLIDHTNISFVWGDGCIENPTLGRTSKPEQGVSSGLDWIRKNGNLPIILGTTACGIDGNRKDVENRIDQGVVGYLVSSSKVTNGVRVDYTKNAINASIVNMRTGKALPTAFANKGPVVLKETWKNSYNQTTQLAVSVQANDPDGFVKSVIAQLLVDGKWIDIQEVERNTPDATAIMHEDFGGETSNRGVFINLPETQNLKIRLKITDNVGKETITKEKIFDTRSKTSGKPTYVLQLLQKKVCNYCPGEQLNAGYSLSSVTTKPGYSVRVDVLRNSKRLYSTEGMSMSAAKAFKSSISGKYFYGVDMHAKSSSGNTIRLYGRYPLMSKNWVLLKETRL